MNRASAILAAFLMVSPGKAETRQIDLGGQTITVEAGAADIDRVTGLMRDFMTAYLTGDRQGLAAVLSPDFVWHLHSAGPTFAGETVDGVEGMLEVLMKRKANWREVRYADIRISAVSNIIVQTFRITGNDLGAGAFDVNGVDIYIVRNGRIAMKDSYWKQTAAETR